MARPARRFIAALLSVVAAAACGGDDEGGATATTAASGSGTGGAPTTGAGGEGGGGVTTGPGTTTSAATGAGGSAPTPCAGDVCDLYLSGMGFQAHDGKTVYVGLLKQGAMGLEHQASTAVQGGAFDVTATAVLQKGVSYIVSYFVDVNENQACDTSNVDDVWRLSVNAVQAHVVLEVTPAAAESNLGCSGFP